MDCKKMIVMDLDGTLLNENGKITEISKQYLTDLKEKGHIIAIATGRMLKSACIATDGAKFTNYIVSDTGAAVYKNDEKWTDIYINEIPKEDAKNMLTFFDEKKCKDISLYNKEHNYKFMNKKYFNDEIIKYYNYKEGKDIIEKIKQISHVSIGFNDNKFVEEYLEIFTSEFPNLDVNIMQDSFKDVKWLEVSQKGVEKYNGISKIAQIENIENKNIIAFGDSLNDIDMLQKCGVGVAMKNALPEVKRVSKYIAKKTNIENGIVEFLKEYL